MFVNINDVIITDRIRQDNGDLTKLVKSIELIGLINPIVISEKYELLSGYRRLQACKLLGWEKIDAKMVSVGNRLQKIDWEYHENIGRKDLSPEEEEAYLAIRQALLHPKLKGLWNKVLSVFSRLFSVFQKKRDQTI